MAATPARSQRRSDRCSAASASAAARGLKVADHARQAQHLVAQRGELVRGGLGGTVGQCLVAGLQDRDRGAQLVGDVGDQVAAQLLLPVQGVGHLVERGRQLTYLTGRSDRADPGGALATSHRPGHGDDLLDRAGDPAGDGEPGRQREQCCQPGSAGDGLL